MSNYIKDRYGYCQRSGQRVRRSELVEDGYIPGLMVHPDWYEPPDDNKVQANSQVDEFKSYLTVPPTDIEDVRVSLPDSAYTGESGEIFRFGTRASVEALLSGSTEMRAALYPFATDYSALSVYDPAQELSGDGYVAGGFAVEYAILDYTDYIVVQILNLTTPRLTLSDVGGVLFYASADPATSVVAVKFRYPRQVNGQVLRITQPIASIDLAIGAFQG